VPRVLIVYASTHGHTAKVASRLESALAGHGAEVELREVHETGELRPLEHDGVIVAASVHGGRHQAEILDWVKHHASALNGMPTAFVSVCLAAADDSDEARQAARDYIDDVQDDTGWVPTRSITVAGALQYREYDFVTRLVMRVLMLHGEHPTDITRDYDYTDWEALDRFAGDFSELLGVPAS
jgi:menaquinone-dependent protoporphyrinogen oxidase